MRLVSLVQHGHFNHASQSLGIIVLIWWSYTVLVFLHFVFRPLLICKGSQVTSLPSRNLKFAFQKHVVEKSAVVRYPLQVPYTCKWISFRCPLLSDSLFTATFHVPHGFSPQKWTDMKPHERKPSTLLSPSLFVKTCDWVPGRRTGCTVSYLQDPWALMLCGWIEKVTRLSVRLKRVGLESYGDDSPPGETMKIWRNRRSGWVREMVATTCSAEVTSTSVRLAVKLTHSPGGSGLAMRTQQDNSWLGWHNTEIETDMEEGQDGARNDIH